MKKQLSPAEDRFAKLIAISGCGSIEAARLAFNWRCETGSSEAQRARDLARSPRVADRIKILKEREKQKAQAENIVQTTGEIDIDQVRSFAFKRLEEIRDNDSAKAAVRFQAIKMLEKLHDPSQDANLIWKWIDLAWRYQKAHCPSCHKSYPLNRIVNPKLEEFRSRSKADPENKNLSDEFTRRLELLIRADQRRRPHASQQVALSSPERHVVGLGAARAGKSYLLSLFAILAFLLPGVEIWILAEQYESARSEVEYIEKFLKALFYPHEDAMVKTVKDNKTGELVMHSKWGSELRIKSAKSKGTITGRALELALVAEPGWVPDDVYNHLRARMSERLGRIIALGTPQGTTGFLGRMIKTTGRDPKTGKILRRSKEDRLIKNGSPWATSMFIYDVKPADNPEYVKAELDAARQELTDSEYATEFAGEMRAAEGAKFPRVTEKHLQTVPREFFDRAVYVLGIDQGPRNFGAVLTAYDGDIVVPCFEYFNGDETTMHVNLKILRKNVPQWILGLGGDPNEWRLTITDRDPQLDGIFEEFREQGLPWPTDLVVRHRNNAQLLDNWRRETQEWVNNMGVRGKLIFHEATQGSDHYDIIPGAALLHDQVINCTDEPENAERESKSDNRKGWKVTDPWRGDHVLDAWYFTMWTVLSNQLVAELRLPDNVQKDDPWSEQKAAFQFAIAKSEMQELRTGGKGGRNVKEAYEKFFNRPMRYGGTLMGGGGHYGNES